MKGLVFDLSIPKYAVAKGVGGLFPRVHYGKGSSLSLRDLPQPKLPAGQWLRMAPVLSGLCGSDLATIFFKASPQLEPFNSFPAVLGHEVVARATEIPDGVRGIESGARYAVNPLLPCKLRAFEAVCRQCAEGHESGCEHAAEGCLSPGLMLGFCKDLPGGIGTELVANAAQLHRVPEKVSDKAAVLIEPLAVSTHAVLKHPPRDDERVLIIGGGPVAFATLWAIRALGHKCHVTLLTVEAYQLELAKALGADEVMRASKEALEETKEVARRTEGRVYSPIIGPPTLVGGFHRVFECVGTQMSLSAALRYTRAFGTIVLIGAASVIKELDWTSVWKNELTVAGSYVYGVEDFRGARKHTFDVVIELLERGEGPDPSPLVTHVFGLTEYGQAIEANIQRGKYKSVKTVFDPSKGAT